MLGFSTVGMLFFYIAYRYNILYVIENKTDTKGLMYPRALQQLLTGVYLGEISLIGIFALSMAIGPLILMIVFLAFTIIFHVSLNSAIKPLFENLPKSLENPRSPEVEKLELSSSLKPNFIVRFFKPYLSSDYATLRELVQSIEPIEQKNYLPPSITSKWCVWVPEDNETSLREVSGEVSNKGCRLDGCKLVIDDFNDPQISEEIFGERVSW
jgi:ABC-type transport system involved in multi-copper enzyme maturation permease subunit